MSAITLRSGKELQVLNQAEKLDFTIKSDSEEKLDAAQPDRDDAEIFERQPSPSIPLPFPNKVT